MESDMYFTAYVQGATHKQLFSRVFAVTALFLVLSASASNFCFGESVPVDGQTFSRSLPNELTDLYFDISQKTSVLQTTAVGAVSIDFPYVDRFDDDQEPFSRDWMCSSATYEPKELSDLVAILKNSNIQIAAADASFFDAREGVFWLN